MLLLSLALLVMVMGTPIHHLEARQSSDGCGPNPLATVMAYAREFGEYKLQCIRVLFVMLLHSCFGVQRISAHSSCCASSRPTREPGVNYEISSGDTMIAFEQEMEPGTRRPITVG